MARIAKGQKDVHIGAEIAGVVAAPIGTYLAVTKVKHPGAQLFFVLGSMTTFFVDAALISRWIRQKNT